MKITKCIVKRYFENDEIVEPFGQRVTLKIETRYSVFKIDYSVTYE